MYSFINSDMRIQTGKIITTVSMLALLTLQFLKTEAEAIPVFARKYRTSCMTCHIAFPKLNPFGEAFRRNGYQIPEFDEKYIKEKPIRLGAPAWKEVWPEGVWPGELPVIPPISLSGDFLYRYDESSQIRHDFIFPDEIELFSAGSLDKGISFFGDVALIQDGNEFGGVERFFIQFNNLLSNKLSGHFINVMIGQFEPAYVPASNSRRLTHTAYLINTFEAGKNKFHFGDQRGIEVNGIMKSRFDYAIGVVNGNGTGKMEGTTGSLDNNSKKDTYLKIGYKLGGRGLDGSGIKEGEWLHGDWKESSVYIGVFGYYGEDRVDQSLEMDDRFYRYGLNISLNYNDINLFGAVIAGNHNNPDGDFKKRDVFSNFVETDIAIYPWLIGILRYSMTDTDYGQKQDEAVAGFVALIRANVKLIIEGKFDTIGVGNDSGFIKLNFVI